MKSPSIYLLVLISLFISSTLSGHKKKPLSPIVKLSSHSWAQNVLYKKKNSLSYLISYNDISSLKSLLKCRPTIDLNKKVTYNLTALELAFQKKHCKMHTILLAYGAPIAKTRKIEENMSHQKIVASIYGNQILEWELGAQEHKAVHFMKLHPRLQKIIVQRLCAKQDRATLKLLNTTNNIHCSWHAIIMTCISMNRKVDLKYFLTQLNAEKPKNKPGLLKKIVKRLARQ